MNSIEKFNKLSKTEFISIFGNIFEKTQWIAERCYELKPYNNLAKPSSRVGILWFSRSLGSSAWQISDGMEEIRSSEDTVHNV